MIIDKTVYRANDIRGIADEADPGFQLTDDFCYLTGLAYVELLRKYRGKEPGQAFRVVVGKDVRNSGLRMKTAFINALRSRGVYVIDIAPKEKVSSTPLMYFAVWFFDADGGVEVTGSHLDKEWNGFKFCIGSESTTEAHIREMYHYACEFEAQFKAGSRSLDVSGGKGNLIPGPSLSYRLRGELEEVDVLPEYQDMIRANIILRERWEELALQALYNEISLKSALQTAREEIEQLPCERRKPLTGLKIVYDAGNGTTGVIAPSLFRDLGAEVFELYSEPDGNFPNHLPDPTIPEFLKDLNAEVARTGAQIGLSSDCDGDRAGAVSPGGGMIIGEQILALLCKHILREHPRAKIVYDIKCSDAIREIITENSGIPVECKTGFSFIKEKMDAVAAVAGGEMSGHVYFAKNNRSDDAVFAFSELLLLIVDELRLRLRTYPYSGSGRSAEVEVAVVDNMLTDFLSRYVNTPEIRVPVVSDDEKERISDAIEGYYRELAANEPDRYRRRVDEAGEDIDGVKIEFRADKGWALIRRSNTSPVIILRMEARKLEGLRRIEEHVIAKFLEFTEVDLNADEYVRGIVQRVVSSRVDRGV